MAAAVSPPTANFPARSRNVAAVDVAVLVLVKEIEEFLGIVRRLLAFHVGAPSE